MELAQHCTADVLATQARVTNYPQTQRCQATYIYDLMVSVGQEARSSLAGWFRLRVSQEFAVKTVLKSESSKSLTGGGKGDRGMGLGAQST